MIFSMFIGAQLFSYFLNTTRAPQAIGQYMANLQFPISNYNWYNGDLFYIWVCNGRSWLDDDQLTYFSSHYKGTWL